MVSQGVLYIDMDGVLARFEQAPNAMERFLTEPNFFFELAPTKWATELGNAHIGDSVYILTSSPHEQADKAKRAWIAKYIPELKDKVICVRSGQEKSNYAKGNTLVDDYTENLKYWVEKGGQAVKALNGLNGLKGRHKAIADTIVVD